MKRTFKCLAGALALASLGLAPAAVPAPATRPNIVYVLADQWRASATGYAGDPNVKTPHLDRLAQGSLNFRNAVSVMIGLGASATRPSPAATRD